MSKIRNWAVFDVIIVRPRVDGSEEYGAAGCREPSQMKSLRLLNSLCHSGYL